MGGAQVKRAALGIAREHGGRARAVRARLPASEARPARRKLAEGRGQMTIELVAMIPVVIVVAVIAANALLFFSECAAFDRLARSAVCTQAVSPAVGQGIEEIRSLIESQIGEGMGLAEKDYLDLSVAVANAEAGQTRFTATLSFSPTLFGLGLKDEVFGVALPRLSHSADLAVEVYKPGVLF